MVARLGAEMRRLELEARIRSIERALGDSVRGITLGVNDVDVESVIPTPDGFSVVLGAANITVKWEDPDIPVTEFDFFEVQFATDSGFTTNLFTDKTKSTKYSFIDGDPLTTYYTRMRVALNDGRVSDYTVTLNTQTGQIVTEDIDSVTEPASAYTRTLTTIGAGVAADLQTVTLTATGKSVVILMSVSGDLTGSSLFIGDMRLYRNATELFVVSTRQSDWAFAYVDEAPGTGSVTYRLEFTNTFSSAFDFIDRSLIVFEVQVL
jgi:hypothetical protein